MFSKLSITRPLALLVVVVAAANGLYIQNQAIKVGISEEFGIAVDWLSDNNLPDKNLINRHDTGRCLQQSYYADPDPRKPPCVYNGVSPWPWNPLGAGSQHGQKTPISFKEKNNTYIKYTSNSPLQWACNNRHANTTFDTEVFFLTEAPNAFVVRNTFTNHRTWPQTSSVHDQESPALYGITQFTELWTASGGKLVQENLGPCTGKACRFNVPGENWMAFAEPSGQRYAFGIFSPSTSAFNAGLLGSAGGGDRSNSAFYVAPVDRWAIGANSRMSYCAVVAIGNLNDINELYNQLIQTGFSC